MPIGMKDLFAVKGIRMTAASKMLEDFIPPYESAISQRLQDAGTVLLGKTNLDEFAMGTFSITSHFGAPVSPYKTERRLTAGGSSGGSASAVAAGLAAAATGTDTGGSIRFPSAMTGLVGLKPTYGVCSRYGCIAFASSLDHPGPMARTVDDCELLFRAMMGHDPREATSSPQMPSEQIRAARCIGVVQEFESVEIAPDMKRLRDLRLRELADRGAKIVVVSIPNILDALAAYYVIAPAEASSNLARYDGVRFGRRAKASAMGDMYELSRAEGFGTEVQRRMIIGSAVLSSQS
ncbi:MAG: Asp-tRNA(Asn)/Glu-tRNA(Gln) amidotransferase subunit GatA, partial [Rickettsiales bacterium]|nr:Asp-tRNA(Asn)/Glu-tRNA(Gln) amidotransferase subunit GatA [Rickettsiales bacterium]